MVLYNLFSIFEKHESIEQYYKMRQLRMELLPPKFPLIITEIIYFNDIGAFKIVIMQFGAT